MNSTPEDQFSDWFEQEHSSTPEWESDVDECEFDDYNNFYTEL